MTAPLTSPEQSSDDQATGHPIAVVAARTGPGAMTSHRLHRTTVIPAGLAGVFEFFRNPRNLEAITPPWLGFRILFTSDDTVRQGTRIRYRLRIAGIPMSWESRISEYENGLHFADEQIIGPYKRWYHRHTFRTVPAGVEMTDAVDYVLPFGPLGRLAHWLIVRHLLRAIFDYRTTIITERFGASAPSVITPDEPMEISQ